MAITTGDMAAGDVLVVDCRNCLQVSMRILFELKEVVTGDTAFVAGQTYEIATMGTSNGVVDIDNFAAFDA